MLRENLKSLFALVVSEVRERWPDRDMRGLYNLRGEQLQKEREDHAARLAIERDLVNAHKERGDAMASGWGRCADERDAWRLRCEEALAKLAPLENLEAWEQRWKAVLCTPMPDVPDQYNVARRKRFGGDFWPDGAPKFDFEHFGPGGFTKLQAQDAAERLNSGTK